METATGEPIPAASQQDLTGSKTADLSVIYDSEDANYCALVDELVRGIESIKGQTLTGISLMGLWEGGTTRPLTCLTGSASST